MYCCFVIFHESVYFTLCISIWWTFIYRTSAMNSLYHINLFYFILVLLILLQCCIYDPLWSEGSTHCKWELMFYCFTVPNWSIFLLSLLILVLHQHLPKTKNNPPPKKKASPQKKQKNNCCIMGSQANTPKWIKSLPDLQDHAPCC